MILLAIPNRHGHQLLPECQQEQAFSQPSVFRRQHHCCITSVPFRYDVEFFTCHDIGRQDSFGSLNRRFIEFLVFDADIPSVAVDMPTDQFLRGGIMAGEVRDGGGSCKNFSEIERHRLILFFVDRINTVRPILP
jgi:hypothetical protein